MTPIAFFSEEIIVVPHSASDAKHLTRSVTIREFARGDRVSLYQVGKREFLAKTSDGRFMEGPGTLLGNMAHMR